MAREQKRTTQGKRKQSAKAQTGSRHGSGTQAKSRSRTSKADTGREPTHKPKATRKSKKGSENNVLLPRYALILLVAGLSVFGLIMVYSASSVRGFVKFDGDSMYYLQRQAMWIIISTVIAAVTGLINYRIFRRGQLAWVLWGITVLMLIAIFFLGTEGKLGGQRWFMITETIGFQPSEFAKLILIVLVSKILCDWHESKITDGAFAIQLAVAIGVPMALIVAQPDLGTTIILAVTLGGLVFLGGISYRVFIGVGAALAAAAATLAVSASYRLQRILAINPWKDPQGDGWQVINGLYAFGSGGLFGVGLGFSRQKYFYLPEAHTDFIFAIIGEELGLVGSLLVVLAFLALGWAGLQIARNATDRFGRLIAGGATIALVTQAFVNIGCVIGLLPVTGKPLPFISSGGSSMTATFLAVGMILSVSFHSKAKRRSEKRRDTITVVEGGSRASDSKRGRDSGTRLSGASSRR